MLQESNYHNYYVITCMFLCIIADLVYPYLDQSDAASLESLMNGPVKKALNIPARIIHGSQSNKVFSYLQGDFMKPVIHIGINHVYRKNVIAAKAKG